MRNTYYYHISFFILLGFQITAFRAAPLRDDWKDFIDPGILKDFLGQDLGGKMNGSLFEGDIDSIEKDASQVELKEAAKNFINDEKAKWPGGIVPYKISTLFRQRELDFIKQCMKEISRLTFKCVRFVEQTTQTDYVSFVRGLGCYSSVGRQGGKQDVSLTRGCLENLGDAQHELMHALGFYHEISRMDRDKFVTINWDNVDEGNKNQFKMYQDGLVFGIPYDYSSVMHYAFTAFAIDKNLPTIVPTKRRALIGQNKNLSPSDALKIQLAYNCPPADPDASDSDEGATAAKLVAQPTTTTEESQTTTTTKAVATTVRVAEDDETEVLVVRKKKKTPQLQAFRMDPVTADECKALETENCHIAQYSDDCSANGFYIVCQEAATNNEIKSCMGKIGALDRDKPIAIEIFGQRDLPSDIFAAVKNNIIQLFLDFNNKKNLSPSTFRDLQLPSLMHLQIGTLKNLQISKGDFDGFLKLRMLVFSHCAITKVEPSAFESLTSLLTLSLEWNTSPPLTKAEKSQLRNFHCNCEYQWVRDIYKSRPAMLGAKGWGEIWKFGEWGSAAVNVSQVFAPIDCAKSEIVIGSADQTSYSVNEIKC